MALTLHKGAFLDKTSIFTMRDVTADKNVSYVDSDFYFSETMHFAYDLVINDDQANFDSKIYNIELMPNNTNVAHIWLMKQENNMEGQSENKLFTFDKIQPWFAELSNAHSN